MSRERGIKLNMKLLEAAKELDAIFTPLTEILCKECEMNCCKGCAHNGGYFKDTAWAKELVYLMKRYKFSHTKGFLGRFGCKLPRIWRSRTCLRVVCQRMEFHLGWKYSKVDRRVVKLVDIITKAEDRFSIYIK